MKTVHLVLCNNVVDCGRCNSDTYSSTSVVLDPLWCPGGLRDTLEPAFHAPVAAGMGEDRMKDMCLLFARKEKILGEIDRARAIYTHASQSARLR